MGPRLQETVTVDEIKLNLHQPGDHGLRIVANQEEEEEE